jgi:hypothetical protein
MRRGYVIRFAGVRSPGDYLVHRVHNFTEDLQVDLQRHGWGTVDNPDTATDAVFVTPSSERMLGEVARAIRRALRHHQLSDESVVARREGDGL